jgi:hypothetical protein
MQTTTAILIGAALLSGAVVWTGERVITEAARDARCRGYLASPRGSEALFALSALDVQSKRRADLEHNAAGNDDARRSQIIAELQRRGVAIPTQPAAAMAAPQSGGQTKDDALVAHVVADAEKDARKAEFYLAGFRLVGCRFNQHPDY